MRPQRKLEQAETRPGSAVSRIGDHRLVHLVSILPLTQFDNGTNIRSPIDFRICLEASAYLALQHLNSPSEALVPSLEARIGSCNVRFSVELRDSQFSPIEGARQLLYSLPRHPFAILGAARSTVSITLATLAGAYELPQISPSSTATALDDKSKAPYFARTVPTNSGDALAFVLYLQSLEVYNFGVLYTRDDYGTGYHQDLVTECNLLGLKLTSASYSGEDLEQSIAFLAMSRLRYFIGVFNPDTWQDVMKMAIKYGIVGPGYTWIFSDASLQFTSPSFFLDRATQSDLAHALHGTGVLSVDIPSSPALGNALDNFFQNETQFSDYVARHAEPTIFTNFTSPMCGGSSEYVLLAYDAVLALGITACETPQEFFTGIEFYQQLLQIRFNGISGNVSFNNQTGTRNLNDLSYGIDNIRISQQLSTDSIIRFETCKAVTISLKDAQVNTFCSGFVYADNSTTVPPPYPPLVEQMNLTPPGIQALGLLFGGIVMCLSLFFLFWTLLHRKHGIVRASQPIFLCQISIGTFIMASAVIPLSLQEPVSQRGLDVACMISPWLVSIGFVTSFAALFAKTWRLNKIFNTRNESGFRRIEVQPQDVLIPFFVLMAINIIMLTAWTIVSPLRWVRVPKNSYDSFGRVNESYGICSSGDRLNGNQRFPYEYIFISIILVADFVAVLGALYECYVARDLPSEFSESFYIAVSVIMIFETTLFGVPILILTLDNPTASFMTRSILLSFVSLCILLPIFAPKYVQQRIRRVTDPTGSNRRRLQRATLRRVATKRRWPRFSGSRDIGAGAAQSGNAGVAGGEPRRLSANGRLSRWSSASSSFRWSTSARDYGETRVFRSTDYFEQRSASNSPQIYSRKSLINLFGSSEQIQNRTNKTPSNSAIRSETLGSHVKPRDIENDGRDINPKLSKEKLADEECG